MIPTETAFLSGKGMASKMASRTLVNERRMKTSPYKGGKACDDLGFYGGIVFPKLENLIQKSGYSGLFLRIFRDVGNIAEVLAVIQTVSDHKAIGNGEQREIGLEIHNASLGLIQERNDTQGKGIAPLQ